jgi:hypothetical protein
MIGEDSVKKLIKIVLLLLALQACSAPETHSGTPTDIVKCEELTQYCFLNNQPGCKAAKFSPEVANQMALQYLAFCSNGEM